MNRAIRSLVGAVAILSAAGCGIAAPSSAEAVLTGSWSGRTPAGAEAAFFTMSVTQNGSDLTGAGTVVRIASGESFAFDVTGSKSGTAVPMTLKFRSDHPDVALAGVVAGWGTAIDGRLTGGNLVNDRPFANTSLMLTRIQ